jgi:hypothetical protein
VPFDASTRAPSRNYGEHTTRSGYGANRAVLRNHPTRPNKIGAFDLNTAQLSAY